MWNRWFILLAVGISLLLPLIDIPLAQKTKYRAETSVLPVFTVFTIDERQSKSLIAETVDEEASQRVSVIHYFGILYAGICILLFCRLIIQISKLIYFSYTYKECKYIGYRLIYTEGKLPTFSFFKLLFWDNTQELSQEHEKIILKHELVHIRQWHSLDSLLLELLKIVCWFNPAVYLLKQALTGLHEYLADAAVVKQYNARQYIQVMAKQVFKSIDFTFIHSFNQSQIYKRLAMIQISRHAEPAFWKLTLCLPLIATLFFVYSCRSSEVAEPPQTAQKNIDALYRMGEVVVVGYGVMAVMKDGNEKLNKYKLPVPLNKIEEEVYVKVDEFPSPINGTADFQKSIQEAVNHSGFTAARGAIYVQLIVDEEGNILNPSILYGMDPSYDAQILDIIRNGPKWNPGKKDGKPVKVRMIVPIAFGKAPSNYPPISDIKELPKMPATDYPSPEGGLEAFCKHILKTLKYPNEARSNLIAGQVVVSFVVQKDGRLASIEVLKSAFPPLDAEVVRVIQESALRWKPVVKNGLSQESKIVLPVTFKIK